MFTESELNTLRSCWVLPDGILWSVPPESHDRNLPDGYYNDNWQQDNQIAEVEQTCFRMSFSWGWDAEISQMTIASTCQLTEPQMQIIRYLLMAKIIDSDQIEYYGKSEDFYNLLTEVHNALKENK